jgi:hypothetical protein
LEENENGHLPADFQGILKSWESYYCHLLCVLSAGDAGQTEVRKDEKQFFLDKCSFSLPVQIKKIYYHLQSLSHDITNALNSVLLGAQLAHHFL